MSESIPDYLVWWPKMRFDVEQLLQMGVTYRYGAEARAEDWPPKALDCSELLELLYARRGIPCPDGASIQWKECVPAGIARPGDLGFWRDHKKAKPGRDGIYHVGMLWLKGNVVEMRAKDTRGQYGKLILRPRTAWESWGPFKDAGGWRRLRILTEHKKPYEWITEAP